MILDQITIAITHSVNNVKLISDPVNELSTPKRSDTRFLKFGKYKNLLKFCIQVMDTKIHFLNF